jgi:hypothetical protein
MSLSKTPSESLNHIYYNEPSKNLTAKVQCRARNIEGVIQLHSTVRRPIKAAALGYQLRRRGTEGAEGLFCQPSRLLVACKANRYQISTHASILIRLSSLLTAFVFAVNSLPLCQLTKLPQIQMSFGTGSIENGGAGAERVKGELC